MKQITHTVWVDDTKDCPKELRNISNTVIICRNYKQAITALEKIYEKEFFQRFWYV